MGWCRRIGLGLATALWLVAATTGSTQAQAARRTLVVSLYPYIPEGRAAYFAIEQAFEARHPDINLQIELAEASYYEHKPGDGGIVEQKADVYELDSVLLADAVKAGKIQPLPGDWSGVRSGLVPMAQTAATYEGRLFGVPHWLCGNFLISRAGDAALGRARTLAEVESALAKPFPGQWLFVDFSGRSTLGEMYLDGLMDRYKSPAEALARLDPAAPDAEVVAAMTRVLKHVRPGFGRDGDYHDRTGFYARQFGRGEGRAMVGYSEQLHYVLSERLTGCRKDEACLAADDVQVSEWPLSDAGSAPIAWVDLLVLDAALSGAKLRDAETFVRFMAEPDTYRLLLVPAWGQAPRYLMPAREDLFSDPKIVEAAPLYPSLLSIIRRATPVTAPDLNRRLREVGKALDNSLPASPGG